MAAGAPDSLTFPTDLQDFDSDERISFSKVDKKYIAVHDDGNEYEFDEAQRRWVPAVDDDADDDDDMASLGVGAELGRHGHDDARPGQKRKPDDAYPNTTQTPLHTDGHNAASKPKRAKGSSAPRQPKQNTAVYVTGLPHDATVDEVAEVFSRKCGVIAEEIDSGRPRIKMYTDADGQFKGDALVVFFKPQSVDIAVLLLDDTEFRIDARPGATRHLMHVQAADMSYKKTNYVEAAGAGVVDGDGVGVVDGASATKPAVPKHANGGAAKAHDKQKIIKKTQKLDAKLADWSSDEDDRFFGGSHGSRGSRGGAKRNPKWDKVVVLKHMFTLAELDEDPAALLDIKEDIRDECAKLGDVTNVVLFDQEPAGIVSVKFKTADAAAACVRLMDGRAFDGRVVEATLATGQEKYKRSKTGGATSESE